MSKLQIIYTPETDHFRLDDIKMLFDRQPGDPILNKLRGNYQRLKESFSDLPLEVGIATYHDGFKKECLKSLKEIREDSLIKSTTTYLSLDILKNALDLRKKDTNDPTTMEFVYRTLMYLISNESILLDKDLKSKMAVISLIPIIPKVKEVWKDVKKTEQFVKNKGIHYEHLPKLIKNFDDLMNKYPSWDDLNKIYEYIDQRFNANKVSKEFPLYFSPPGTFFPSLYLVSLVDEIEIPDYVPELLKILKLGAKAQGLDKIPEDVKKQAMIGQKDKFGETKRIDRLDELLTSLPEPKTIITDIYIVDQFPELKETQFETKEFKLE